MLALRCHISLSLIVAEFVLRVRVCGRAHTQLHCKQVSHVCQDVEGIHDMFDLMVVATISFVLCMVLIIIKVKL